MSRERTDAKRRTTKGIPSELYTTEASESRKRAVGEQGVADPTPEQAEAAIAKHNVEEDDGEAD